MSDIPNIGFVSSITSGGDELPTEATFHPEGDCKKNAFKEFKEQLKKELREELKAESKAMQMKHEEEMEAMQMKHKEEMEAMQMKHKEEFRKVMQKFIDENVYLRQILKDSGEEKKNWWKVLALALGFGIVGVATGGSIPMLMAGSIALTGNVAVGAAIGGTVGVAIGGVGGHAHENKRLRSMKKSK